MKISVLAIVLTVSFLFASNLVAQDNAPVKKAHLTGKGSGQMQQKKTENSKSPQLTGTRTIKPERKKSRLKFEEAKAKFEGRATTFEHKKLRREENLNSKDVNAKKQTRKK